MKLLGTSWEYFLQYKQLYASATGRYMYVQERQQRISQGTSPLRPTVQTAAVADGPSKWHDAVLVPRFDLCARLIYATASGICAPAIRTLDSLVQCTSRELVLRVRRSRK